MIGVTSYKNNPPPRHGHAAPNPHHRNKRPDVSRRKRGKQTGGLHDGEMGGTRALDSYKLLKIVPKSTTLFPPPYVLTGTQKPTLITDTCKPGGYSLNHQSYPPTYTHRHRHVLPTPTQQTGGAGDGEAGEGRVGGDAGNGLVLSLDQEPPPLHLRGPSDVWRHETVDDRSKVTLSSRRF